jgi:hypothetical protein
VTLQRVLYIALILVAVLVAVDLAVHIIHALEPAAAVHPEGTPGFGKPGSGFK